MLLSLAVVHLAYAAHAGGYGREDSHHHYTLVGSMGAGKTYITNQLCSGADFKTCSSATSCTKSSEVCSTLSKDEYGANISLIDTVGFNDNTDSGGYARSLIETLQAMDGKIICKIVYIHGCHSRGEISAIRSLQAIQRLTGVEPVILQNDRGQSDCYELPNSDKDLGSDLAYLAGKTMTTLKELDGDVVKLPGGSKCKEIHLQGGWQELIKREDYDEVQRVLSKYAAQQCDVVVTQYKKAVSVYEDAKAKVDRLKDELYDARTSGPKHVTTHCSSICVEWKREKKATGGCLMLCGGICFFTAGLGCKVCLAGCATEAMREGDAFCARHQRDPECVAENKRLEINEKSRHDKQLQVLDERISEGKQDVQRASEAVAKLQVGHSRCSAWL